MREFVEQEADRLGVTPTEFLRRLLEVHRDSRAGETYCEHCGGEVRIDLTYT